MRVDLSRGGENEQFYLRHNTIFFGEARIIVQLVKEEYATKGQRILKRHQGWVFCTCSEPSSSLGTYMLAEDRRLSMSYAKSMRTVLGLFDKGVARKGAAFNGLKKGAIVFWRNYPEFENMDDIVADSYANVHLLDVRSMQREQAKICSVLGRPRNGSTNCDKVHYCVGTVQHAWNYTLAREVLGIRKQQQVGKQPSGRFTKTANIAYGIDHRNCAAPEQCNGFQIDPRYICPENNTAQFYEWQVDGAGAYPRQEMVDAFHDQVVCFFGDSISGGQQQTLANEMRARTYAHLHPH
jgi:hypothetical protein